ncbi:hypothetical protein AJ80_08472 [Polytolypa hystricis UAMH7299]|uniref:DNA repair protein rhp7 treble clef domain-containing protein n=1 Tax=Polytolypa hystricis (strain UAMH7299) TaxID=1447883 RepID=A0A2B7X7M9_POLH7|nr:hypothetical protein AJ80_08472 [Polytolypa hystricis UAMH7299]
MGKNYTHSALTDFLASNNISAADIRDNYLQRLRDAERQGGQTNGEDAAANEESTSSPSAATGPLRKRKRKDLTTLAKSKKPRDDDQALDDLMYQKRKTVPGQLANCEFCSKRFTVTAYSKTGPDGDFLCTSCSKELINSERKPQAKRRGASKKSRRQNLSNLLDGIVQRGAFSLLEMCIRKVADNIHDIEEFGDLPEELLLKLSQILSRRRVLTSRTLELFLRRDLKSIHVYDCAKLETEDFQKTFAFMPDVTAVNLRFAGQLKDENLEYMKNHNLCIKDLQLDGCNLISDGCWQRYFMACGSNLESIKLANLDCSLNDETMRQMAVECPNLRHLKLRECWLPGDNSLASIATLQKLEHLSLDLLQETTSQKLVDLIENVGRNLRTLALRRFMHADDAVLDAIHNHCGKLSKLRFADNTICSDKAFERLFSDWNNPPLAFVDLSGTRDIDDGNPDGPDEVIGLASDGFKALMLHSGEAIEKLNIGSCRHISHEALSHVFDGHRRFPRLKELDISMHTSVDDFLIGCIFKSCPAITKVIAFACFNVRDMAIPPGVALIGGLNARLSIDMQEGRTAQ